MSAKKYFFVLAILFSVSLLFCASLFFTNTGERYSPPSASELERGCTVIMVAKNASTDGSIITTHTADCGVCDWTWRHIPAADHPPESTRKIYRISQMRTWPPEQGLKWDLIKNDFSGVEIAEIPHTYAYRHGVFGYMNEHQLAIGESTIGCVAKLRNPTPTAIFDITTLTMIAMERCRTAREAIKLMGSLAEKYGYGYHDSGEMLAVADPEEVWVFEIMPVGPLWTPASGKPGALWCAQRVPDDQVSVCPNESRIGEVDLNKKDYFIASSNVVSCAIENGLYDPASGQPFNWKKAYSPAAGSASNTRGRRGRLWRFFDLVAPSQKFNPDTENMDFPFSVKPDKKLSVGDVITMTRDKYQGNFFDPAKGLRAGPFSNPNYFQGFGLEGKNYTNPRCIGVSNVEYTTVTQSRKWLPDLAGGIIWLCFGAQDTSCYMPIYSGVTEIPSSFSVGDHWVFNRESARWAFDYVDFHTQLVYSYAIEDVKKAQAEWEETALARTPSIDKTAQELYRQDPKLAAEFVTDYCVNNANKVVEAWWKLGDFLLVKYNHLRIYESKTRRVDRLNFPEWWLRMVVEQDKVEPLPPREKKGE